MNANVMPNASPARPVQLPRDRQRVRRELDQPGSRPKPARCRTGLRRITTLALLALTAPLAASVLHDNGPLITSSGNGADGGDVSMVQTWMGNFSYGANASRSAAFRLADDFTVPAGGWMIDRVRLYVYVTGAGDQPAAVNLRIWDGAPGAPGSSVVFGDTATNRLTAVHASSVYRAPPETPADPDRRILELVAAVGGIALPAGTWWLDWQVDAPPGNETWSPFVTLDDVPLKPGANALQFDPDAGAWKRVRDAGSNKSQDLPFRIESGAQLDVIFADGFDA